MRMENGQLASGATAAATEPVLVLAEQAEQAAGDFLSVLEAAAANRDPKLNAVPVIRALPVDQSSAGEVLGATFTRESGWILHPDSRARGLRCHVHHRL